MHKLVGATSVAVGTSDSRAPWHEFGTKPFTIRPGGGKFLRFQTQRGIVFSKEVDHPGLPSRPMLPTKRIARKLAVGVLTSFVAREVRTAGNK